MKEFLQSVFSVLGRAQLEHFTLFVTLALVGVVVWVGTSGFRGIKKSIQSLSDDIKDTNSRVDKTNKDLADFKNEIAKDYVTQNQLDRRIGGLKEMIAALTEIVNEMNTKLAVFMATGKVPPKTRTTPKKGK